MHIAQLLPDIPTEQLRPTIKSERAYIISLFLEKINEERGTYKPMTAGALAFKLSHLKKDDLYFFYGQCEKANCGFSKCFWGALKTDRKPVEKKWLTSKWKRV